MNRTSYRSTASAPGFRVAAFALVMLAFPLSATSSVQAQRNDHVRLRAGISGVGGGFAGATHGALGGISPRIGVQLGDHFAVYVQGQGLVGQFLPRPGDGLAGLALHSLMVELTLGDVFQLGIGPSLDYVWGCHESYQRSCVGAGPYLGGDGRIAVVLGNRGPGRRSGLAFSFDVHPTWFGDDALVTLLLGVGYEVY